MKGEEKEEGENEEGEKERKRKSVYLIALTDTSWVRSTFRKSFHNVCVIHNSIYLLFLFRR
jgi:hypothetical protein